MVVIPQRHRSEMELGFVLARLYLQLWYLLCTTE